jgi:hypothetical protein
MIGGARDVMDCARTRRMPGLTIVRDVVDMKYVPQRRGIIMSTTDGIQFYG